MIKATIIADSISKHTNQRITTFELEYPRFIHAELLTHRMFSRNSASSRAIPVDKMIELVETSPAMPIHWGLNQKGMQAEKQIDKEVIGLAKDLWLDARDNAIETAKQMQVLGLHKQVINRILEPFQMMKTLVTATDFENFFELRCHKDAQPEIQALANAMKEAMDNSKPELLESGEWHTPYVYHARDENTNELMYFVEYDKYDFDDQITVKTREFIDLDEALMISASCAAQVSYRRNDISPAKAKAIYDKLISSKPIHASPFEHCATPMRSMNTKGVTHISYSPVMSDNSPIPYSGNFTNWVQYRQLL